MKTEPHAVIEAEVLETDVVAAGEPAMSLYHGGSPATLAASEAPEPAATAMTGVMAKGDTRFGVTCTAEPIGTQHWLVDSSTCGDLVMALPASVLIAGRSATAGGVAVDMIQFLDAVIAGAGRLQGLPGIAEEAGIPSWAVSRLFGTFPVLLSVYGEAMDQVVLTVEAAAIKAACGLKTKNVRQMTKHKDTPDGPHDEVVCETLEKDVLPDPALSKMILTSRMKGRYKEESGVRQAVVINITGAEADV